MLSSAVKDMHVIRLVCGLGELAPNRRIVLSGDCMSQRKGPERSAEQDAKCVSGDVMLMSRTG